jgi:hypothetical protein
MKKQSNPNIQAHLIQGTFYVILLVTVCALPFALGQRKATKQSVAKLSSASGGLVEARTALPASIIVVTNTNDSGPGSLRDALAMANDGDTIDATGISGTILLTSGELPITHSVTINGPGAGTLAVNGNGSSRVFENWFEDVTISGFTITNGRSDSGGGIRNPAPQNICCGGSLTVTNCTISGNSADYDGGGIANSAGLTVSNSTISGNSASYGGGISGGGTIINSTLSGNSADYGAGIWCRGGTIINSTLSGNSADVDGGGVYNTRGGQLWPVLLSIENSTVSGNSATGNGGSIYNDTGFPPSMPVYWNSAAPS